MNKAEKNISSLRSSRNEYIILAMILILGTALRLLNLNVGFFGDELHTIRVALCYPFSYIISNNWGSFFYQILVHFLLPLGQQELVARMPAVVFGILGIYALFRLTRHLFGRKEALLAAAYMAILPFHIYWSQTARGYSAFLYFSLMALCFFLGSLKDNRLRFWAGYIVFSILAAYSHLFYLFCLASHAGFEGILFLLGLKKKRRHLVADKRHLVYFVSSLILIAAVALVLYYPDLTRGSGIERITLHSKFSQQTRPVGTNISLFIHLIHKTFLWVTQSWNPNLSLSLILAFLLIMGMIASLKKHKSHLILIILSIAVPVALFLFGGPSDSTVRNAPDRYLTYLLPFFLILISKGGTAFWDTLIKTWAKLTRGKTPSRNARRWNATGPVTIFIFLFILLLPQIQRIYQYRKSQPDFKGALEHVNKNIDTDAVIFFEGSFLLFYEDSNIRDGLQVYIDDYYAKDILILTKYDIEKKIKDLSGRKRQVWSIVYTPEQRGGNDTPSPTQKTFHKLSVAQYERDTLQSNFIKLFRDLLDLGNDYGEDYLLILTRLYLNENDVKNAKGTLRSLRKSKAYALLNRESLKPGWASHALSKRQQLYNRLSHEFFSRGEYEESVFAFLRYAERLIAGDRIDEAVNFLEKYLTPKIQDAKRTQLVAQFLKLFPFDEGIFFLWKDPDGWHLRWNARRDSNLNVCIESSSKIKAVQTSRLEDSTRFQRSDRTMAYQTRTQGEGIAGFDFQVKGRPKLTFDLSINQRIMQKVFFTKKETPPLTTVPRDVKVYTGKAGRTTLFID